MVEGVAPQRRQAEGERRSMNFETRARGVRSRRGLPGAKKRVLKFSNDL